MFASPIGAGTEMTPVMHERRNPVLRQDDMDIVPTTSQTDPASASTGINPSPVNGPHQIGHWRWSWQMLRPLGWNLPWASLTIPVPCMMDPLSNSLLLKGSIMQGTGMVRLAQGRFHPKGLNICQLHLQWPI